MNKKALQYYAGLLIIIQKVLCLLINDDFLYRMAAAAM